METKRGLSPSLWSGPPLCEGAVVRREAWGMFKLMFPPIAKRPAHNAARQFGAFKTFWERSAPPTLKYADRPKLVEPIVFVLQPPVGLPAQEPAFEVAAGPGASLHHLTRQCCWRGYLASGPLDDNEHTPLMNSGRLHTLSSVVSAAAGPKRE
jgi:hypothetical protein